MLREQVKSANMRSLFLETGLRWLWIVPIVFILDRASKYLALQSLTDYTPVPIIPFFNFTLSYNRGAAFSLLNEASGWQTWAFGVIAVVISIAILIWLSRLSYKNRWVSIALALIVGGAVGNLYDRVSYGYVIDFIHFYVGNWSWPIFNLADSSVCIGTFMLIIDILYSPKK